jgi:hypothetical protein
MGLNPQGNKYNKVIEGEDEVFLLESVTHSKEAQIFSQEQESRFES